ncbi:MAG TPA: DUF2795 domain-containing protein [Dehalococcoidia bacterium]
MATNADADEFLRALHGLEFPASRAQILNAAKDKGGLDTEVLYIFGQLPDRTYETAEELRAAVAHAYETHHGGLAGAGPAAPSSLSNADKDLIRTTADPRRGEIDRS